ncbi:MAG: truA [Chloroflexi bacterium]|nr:truA [Chloroflexota bacterium]
MRVIRTDLEYEGTDFYGFAPQPGARTIGGELEVALTRVTGEAIRVTPAGRTDSGVHATGQVVSFRIESTICLADLKRALNALTGADVLVRAMAEADETFDARRSAQTRRYEYSVWNGEDRNIWERRRTAHVDDPLDVEAMDEACRAVVGTHDFASFRTHRTQDDPDKSTVRRVFRAAWSRDLNDGRILRFDIEADAFLRHMVRSIVGSALLVGHGKRPTTSIGDMLRLANRAAAGPTAPASGLTLREVTY